MTEEIKEILEGIKIVIKHEGTMEFNSNELKKFYNYITNLQQKYEIAQKDIESLKNNYNNLIKMSENKIDNLQQENERLKTFIDEIVKTLKHCKLNGTNKLDIVAEFIEKEYDEQINGSDKE